MAMQGQATHSLITFSPIWVEGQKWIPSPGDRHALLWLKHQASTSIAFSRAYSGWRISGAKEEQELGEGRAFLRWMQKRKIGVEWGEKDFCLSPLFSGPDAPTHAPDDELARGLSFAIRPVKVGERKIKLYVQDADMLGLLHLGYGKEDDFLELVKRYIAQRFQWEKWNAPAPGLLDWIKSSGQRPVFQSGQLGFAPRL
jgi:hypothetical protein